MKKVLMILIIAAFCLTMVGIAAAVDAVKSSPAMQVIKPGTIQPGMLFTCPVGWTKKPNVLACVPSKPTPIACPKGYQYYETLNCIGTGGLDYCRGCEIGCYKQEIVK